MAVYLYFKGWAFLTSKLGCLAFKLLFDFYLFRVKEVSRI